MYLSTVLYTIVRTVCIDCLTIHLLSSARPVRPSSSGSGGCNVQQKSESKGRRNIGFDFLVKSIHIKVQYYVSIEVWVIPAKRQRVRTILLCNVHCPCWGVARPGGFLTSSRYNLCTFSSCNVSTVARRVGWVSCPLCDTVLSSKERPLHNKVQMKFNKINKNEDTFAFTTEPRVHCAW